MKSILCYIILTIFCQEYLSASQDEIFRSTAECAIMNAKIFDSGSIIDSEIQLKTSKLKNLPRLTGGITRGEQFSGEESFRSDNYNVDINFPIYNRNLKYEIESDKKNIDIAKSQFFQKAYTLAAGASAEILDYYKKQDELLLLTNDLEVYKRLKKIYSTTGRAGITDQSDFLMVQLATKNLNFKIVNIGLELEKKKILFLDKYGFSIPANRLKDIENTSTLNPVIANPEINVIDAQISLATSEISKEKSYLIPQFDFSAGVFSQTGVLPFNGYRVGINIDFSGLFRGNKIQADLQNKIFHKKNIKSKLMKQIAVTKKIENLEYESIIKEEESMKESIALLDDSKKLLQNKILYGRAKFSEILQINDEVRKLRTDLGDLQIKKVSILWKQFNDQYFSQIKYTDKLASCSLEAE